MLILYDGWTKKKQKVQQEKDMAPLINYFGCTFYQLYLHNVTCHITNTYTSNNKLHNLHYSSHLTPTPTLPYLIYNLTISIQSNPSEHKHRRERKLEEQLQ